jgi:acyl-CoA dehydrogenase family protein 9
VFTVTARQLVKDPKTGNMVDKVTALICTADMPGIEIYEKNRSKCGIRGTWQARIRFHDVRVPRGHRLHVEGKGLNVALSCLDYGRCTLSAGMLGGARRAAAQATKWAQTRFQFHRPLADFELVRAKVARMSALTYAMDAVLYATTAMLDRQDDDLMVETAICKVFCSEMGWRVVNDAMQIMGGEGYMTENEIERIFRDSRINLIVEGANELMASFIFAYGGKQLAERLLGIREALGWHEKESAWSNLKRMWSVAGAAIRLGAQLYLGMRAALPKVPVVDKSLTPWARRLCMKIREHSHYFKRASRHYGEKIVSRQLIQARLADSAMWLHVWACTLSKLNRDIRIAEAEGPRAAACHFMEMAELEIDECLRRIFHHADDSAAVAAAEALRQSDQLPNCGFIIPEGSPVARGTGRRPASDGIVQFRGSASWKSEDHVPELHDGGTLRR